MRAGLLLLLCSCAFLPKASAIDATTRRVPLFFEANAGQAHADVRFIARSGELTALIKDNEATLLLNGRDSVRVRFAGSSRAAKAEGVSATGGTSSYFTGQDKTKWHSGIAHYAKVCATGVYPGIDVVYHANDGQLEFDFEVAPGADPSVIDLVYEGARGLAIDKNGDLKIGSALRQRKPVAYQEIGGKRIDVSVRYAVKGRRVGFRLGAFDAKHALVIDPVLVYSTTRLPPRSIAVDGSGAIYVTGQDRSITPYPNSLRFGSGGLSFVAKLNPVTYEPVYVAYIGGCIPYGIAVDGQGAAYITGITYGSGFPTQAAYSGTFNGSIDAFITKLNPAGNALVYSTYLGGNAVDQGSGIAVDSSGAAYVTGHTDSVNFPLISNLPAASLRRQGFVSKFSPQGNTLAYSTLIAQAQEPSAAQPPTAASANAIAVDASGAAYVTGRLEFGSNQLGASQAFAAKLHPSGNARYYLTPVSSPSRGSGGDIVVDSSGAAYVISTEESQPILRSLVTKLDALGSLVFRRAFEGSRDVYGTSIAIGRDNSIYIAATTAAPEFPFRNGIMALGISPQAHVVKLSPGADTVIWATPLVASGATDVSVDAAGNVFVAGYDLEGVPAFLSKLVDSTPGLAAVATNRDGVSVNIDGALHLPPVQFQWTPGSTHTLSVPPIIQLGSTSRDRLVSWSGGGVLSPSSALQSITATSTSETYLATFHTEYLYALGVDATTGGTVVTEPPLADSYLEADAIVRMQADPAPGFRFMGFTGGLTGVISPLNVRVARSESVTAHFARLGTLIAVKRGASWFFDSNGNRRWDGVPIDTERILPAPQPVLADWNGDGRPKVGSFAHGLWLIDSRGTGLLNISVQYGSIGTTAVVGDWTGDGPAARLGVFQDGQWHLDRNGNNLIHDDPVNYFGGPGDLPVVGDWNNSGTTKIGVFRSGQWFFDMNGNGAWDGAAVDRAYANFGLAGDLPVVGDWTGSGSVRIGVYRSGRWFLDINGNGRWDGPTIDEQFDFGGPDDIPLTGFVSAARPVSRVGVFSGGQWKLDVDDNSSFDVWPPDRTIQSFGTSGDIPVAGDWTGSGRVSLGVYRPSDRSWYLDLNGNERWDGPGIDRVIANYGAQGDEPVVGDWDGTGVTRVGLFRAGSWYLDVNNNGIFNDAGDRYIVNFGLVGDLPVVGDWVGGTRIARVGVYRRGTWFFDMNNDGLWGAGDRSQVFGTSEDRPVVGHWYGSPKARPGLLRPTYFELDTGVSVEVNRRVIFFVPPVERPAIGAWSGVPN